MIKVDILSISFCKKEIIFGKLIPNEELGFKDGGNEEYREATDKIFASIILKE